MIPTGCEAMRRPLGHTLAERGRAWKDGDCIRLEFDDDPEDRFLISIKDLSRCMMSFADHAPVIRAFESLVIVTGIARLSTSGQGINIYAYHYRSRKFVLRRRDLADVARGNLLEAEIAEDLDYRPGQCPAKTAVVLGAPGC